MDKRITWSQVVSSLSPVLNPLLLPYLTKDSDDTHWQSCPSGLLIWLHFLSYQVTSRQMTELFMHVHGYAYPCA